MTSQEAARGVDRVHVGPPEAGYDVLVGAQDVTAEVGGLLRGPVRRVLVVHQRSVESLARAVSDELAAQGFEPLLHVVPDGEAAKTAAVAQMLWSALGHARFTRSDAVVAVGGGAVTDLAGFVAATWLRGVQVVHVPTTLLGMVDAAVGGKTGINTPEGKNLVGAFHEPGGVLVNTSSLRTLPRADLIAGLAEILKGGFIEETRILDLVEADPAGALDPDSSVLRELIVAKIALKARVVTDDLREASRREVLNYGHTFGHAVEHVSGYERRHGEAVAIGMMFAAHLSQLTGGLSTAEVDRHRTLLEAVGLPTTYMPPVGGTWPAHLAAMHRDKKTRGDRLRFVVLAAIGRPDRLEGPAPDEVRRAYDAILA